MKLHRTHLAVGALLALTALGGRALTAAPAGAPAAAPRPAATADPAAARTVYALRLDVDVTLGGDRGGQAVAFSIAGRWESTVARRGGGSVAHVRLSDVRVLRGDPGLAAALGAPCVVRGDAEGRVRSVACAPDATPMASQVMRGVVARLARVQPEGAGARWRAAQADVTGEFVAEYARDGARLTRTAGPYARLVTPRGLADAGALAGQSRAASATFTLDGDDTVRSFVERDRLALTPVAGMTSVALTSLTLERVGGVAAAALDEALVARLSPGAAPLTAAPAARAAHADDARLAATTPLPALLDRVVSARQEPGAGLARTLAELAAHLRAEPSSARDVAARVGAAPRDARGSLVAALGHAGTAESQAALVALAQDRDGRARVEAVMQLGLQERPTEGTVAAARALSRDEDPQVRSTAALARGSLARATEGDPEAAEAVADLARAYRAAPDDDARALALRALGNAGSNEALGPIEDALSSPTRAVRVAAVEALRHVGVARADELLARALADADPTIRAAAVDAIAWRDWAPHRAALLAALRGDPVADVRSAVVTLLARNDVRDVDALAALRWAAEHDGDGALRARASALVAPRA